MNSTQKIKVTNDGFRTVFYGMPSTTEGFADVVFTVDAEVGGHGCLFGIEPPPTAIQGFCWNGDNRRCELDDWLMVLDRILKDYNCPHRIVWKSESIKGISD